jgi:uncharacterized membrane protein YbhN (UPF0104 family)
VIEVSFQWLRIVGICLFIWIATRIDWRSVLDLLDGIQPVYLVGYFGAFLMAVLLKVVRLRWFLRRLGHTVGFGAVYQCVVEPAFYGTLTPARVGEFSKVIYLARHGINNSQGWCIVLLERLVDFSVLSLVSVVGILYFFTFNGGNIDLCMVIFTGLCLLIYFGLGGIWNVFGFAGRIPKRFIPVSWVAASAGMNMEISCKLSANIFFPMSLAILALSFMQLWYLAAGLGIPVNGFYLGLAYAASSLVSLLPLSVAGLGTREAVYMELLGNEGIAASSAVTISLLDGLVLSLIAQSILMLPILIKGRLHG